MGYTIEQLASAMNPQQGAAGPMDFGALLAAMQQKPAAPVDMIGLIQALRAPKGQHLGIGGMPISMDNPQGNPGGNPFTNGFFPHSVAAQANGASGPFAGMDFLGGTPTKNPNFMPLLAASRKAAIPTPWVMPPGDPTARSFWNSIHQ